MIEKRIFYCWFGRGKKSELNERCIRSWREMCPDYEIIEINEDNFDVNSDPRSKEAYERKNWSYVSDVARLRTLEKNNGFYLDTDIELHKGLDVLRTSNAIVVETAFGWYGSCLLARGDRYPEIFKDTFERMNSESPIHICINDYIYRHYDVHGEDSIALDDVTLLSCNYIGNKRKTGFIGTHWEENTWVKGWTGGFRPMSDFVPLEIFVNGERDEGSERRWNMDSRNREARMFIRRKPRLDDVEKANVLMNKKVEVVEWEDGYIFRTMEIQADTSIRRDNMKIMYRRKNEITE